MARGGGRAGGGGGVGGFSCSRRQGETAVLVASHIE
jgi:hypothetical protein